MLRITILNDGTGDKQAANYTYLVRTERTVIVDGPITGHNPADGWRVLALQAIAPGMLEACKATCAAIEFRGKALLAGYDELNEDESNWRDGVEPYLLELYEQNRAIAKAAEGDE